MERRMGVHQQRFASLKVLEGTVGLSRNATGVAQRDGPFRHLATWWRSRPGEIEGAPIRKQRAQRMRSDVAARERRLQVVSPMQRSAIACPDGSIHQIAFQVSTALDKPHR